MKVGDGGATFSLVIYEHLLTLDELSTLKSLDGVDGVLVGDNSFAVRFKVDSFLDITASAVINAQQAIKKTLSKVPCYETSSDAKQYMKTVPAVDHGSGRDGTQR